MASDTKEELKKEEPKEEVKEKRLSDEEFKEQITRDVNDFEKYFNDNLRSKTNYTTNRYLGLREELSDDEIPEGFSNMTYNRGFGIVQGEAAQNMPGLYQPNQFFTMNATDEKSELGVKAMQRLMYAQIANMGFYKQHFWGILDSLFTPVAPIKWGWEYYEKKHKSFSVVKGKGDIKTDTKVKHISQPKVTSLSVYDVFYDWKNYGNRKDMRYAGDKYFVPVEYIRNDKKKYNNRDEVAKFLKEIDSQDVKTRPVQVLVHECFYVDEVGIVTENGYLLCRQDNPYGELPYGFLVKFPVSRKTEGISTIEASADLLDAEDDLLNATFDGIYTDVHKPMLYTGTLNDEDLTVRPNKTIKIKPGQEMKSLFTQPMGNDWINMQKNMDMALNRVLGNIDQIENQGVDTATQSRFVQARANVGRRTYIDYNRENYLKWALEFWIQMNIDNMTEEEVIAAIGEKDAKKLNLIAGQLKLKDINYTITITGDSDDEDRMTYVQNVDTFLTMLQKISVFKQNELAGVKLPINFDLLTQTVVNKFNFPEGVYIEPTEEGASEEQLTIEQEITAAAEGRQMTPEQLIAEIAQKSGGTPEQVVMDIKAAGSFAAYLKTKAEAEGGAA